MHRAYREGAAPTEPPCLPWTAPSPESQSRFCHSFYTYCLSLNQMSSRTEFKTKRQRTESTCETAPSTLPPSYAWGLAATWPWVCWVTDRILLGSLATSRWLSCDRHVAGVP